MNFLRQNLFYVVLVGVTLVCLIVLAIVGSSFNDDKEAAFKQRTDLYGQIKNLGIGAANEDTVKAKRDRLDKMRKAVQAVTDVSIEKNSHFFKALMLKRKAGDGANVFPYDSAKDNWLAGGAFTAIDAYQAQIKDMQKGLKPTTAPSKDEVELEIAHQKDLMKPAGGGASGGAAPATLTEAQNKLAEERGTAIVKVNHAREGRIYILPGAVQDVFSPGGPRPNADVREMWQAQLSLWVQSDILEAIGQTNEQALRGGGAVIRKDWVMNSAVKVLEKITINPYYTFAGPASPGTSGGAGSGNPAPYSTTPPPAGEGTTPAGGALGQKFCTDKVDILNYSFTVIMPTRYVNQLIDNLYARNVHLVLNVSQAEVLDDPQSLYYFGTDSIMRVTIEGQLQLLTAWERGLKETDKQGKEVDKYPPLMPVEVLKSFQLSSPNALRPEDVKRAGPVPTVAKP